MNATAYIILCTARNRFRTRARRLREPRYLVGALAGIGYLVFTLVIRSRAYEARGAGVADDTLFNMMAPVVGGVVLAAAALAAWLMPFPSAVLDFSKAEIAFLFPAPVRRTRLVLHRILRSQAAVFAAALIMALAYPTGSAGGRLRGLITLWVLLMTARLFFAVVVLARAGDWRTGWIRPFGWPALIIPLAAVMSVSGPILAVPPGTDVLPWLGSLADRVHEGATDGAARVLLLPFTLLVRPLFTPGVGAFSAAIGSALAIHAIVVAWLLWADSGSQAFADASLEKQVAMGPGASLSYVARRSPWLLAPSGRPEPAFLWKGLIQTLRTVDRRVMVRIVLVLGWLVLASVLVNRSRGVVLLLGVGATWGALFALFMLPQMLRMDLRQDLEHVELLRSWPVRGASVLRGEIVWPALIVIAIAWFFGGVAMGLSLASTSRIPSANRIAAWTSFLLLCPAIVVAQYTVHNAVAVLFPGWVPLGPSRPRGVDAVGQRLLLLLGNWVGLLVALVPGLAVMALLSITLRRVGGPIVLPVGALVTTLAVFAEAWLATEWLGRAWDRLDVTSVERPD
ncbi:MAG: putative ABC exporter domain-containing protein [Vicinamibacterales bacterium]